MALISMSEIEEMSREAYERDKKDGVAEERERWLPLLRNTVMLLEWEDVDE